MSQLLRKISPLLQVRDLDAALSFYCGRLGFRETYHEDGFRIVAREGCDIHLCQPEGERRPAAVPSHGGTSDYDCYIHCELDAADVLWTEFRKAGAPMPPAYEHGPINRPYGLRDFAVIDPDGHHIAFGSPIEDK